jgi:hypothetical protein
MTKFIIGFISLVAVLAAMLMSILGAAGLCALIWGSSILDTALGSPPQRSHPAFIIFMLVMMPAMVLGAAGGIAAIMLPLFARFGIRVTGSFGIARFMRAHAMRILRVTGDAIDDDSPDKRAA